MNQNDGVWTADDIRENASSWSLQADGKLLEYMQNISKTIEERGNRTTYNLHTLFLDLDQTKIALDNATNQLMSLQHKQFVENRVQDDDETLANADNVPIQADQTNSKPQPTLDSAIQNGVETAMKMIDKYFEKVSLDLSDSDDDDGIASVVLHPKDPYKSRPLPYLIGSKEWYEKWHIGLVESDSDEEVASDNEVDDLESSTPTHSMSTNVPGSLSDSEPSMQPAPTLHKVVRDISPYSSSENLSQKQHESSFDTSDRASAPKIERASYSLDSREYNTANTIFVKQRPANPTHVTPNLIDAEPPALDEDTPLARKKPINLFLDDDNDSNEFNIFDENKPSSDKLSRYTIQGHQSRSEGIRKAPANLFADDDDDDDLDAIMPSTSKITSSIKQQKADNKITNLFENDDDDDIDSDLFTKAPIAASRSTILSNAPQKSAAFLCNLFNDEPPDDDFDVFKTSSKPTANLDVEKSKIKVAQPLDTDEVAASTKPSEAKPIEKTILFDDEPLEDDFDVFKSTTNPATDGKAEKLITTGVQAIVKKTGASANLFDEPPEEKIDMFTSTTKPNNTAAAMVPSEDFSVSGVKTKISMFGDSISDDDIFDNTIKKRSEQISVSKQPEKVPKGANKTKSLWDSDDEIKPEPKSNVFKTKPKNPYDAIRLFDDTPPDDDEDLFSTKVTKPKATKLESRPQGEFYNDFSETIVPKRSETVEKFDKAPTEIESPTDAQIVSTETPDDQTPQQKHQVDDSKPSEISQKINLFDKSATSDEDKVDSQRSKPQPKKLNIAKIDINVAALLPGAKRAKPPEHIKSAISSEPEDENESLPISAEISGTSSQFVGQDNVDNAGRLSNLNRNRAQGNLKRRPSTRHGRQQQYQKLLDDLGNIDSVDNQLETNIPQTEALEKQPESEISAEIVHSKPLEEIFAENLVISKIIDENKDEENKIIASETSSLEHVETLGIDETVQQASPNTIDESKDQKLGAIKLFLDSSIFDDDDTMDNEDSNTFVNKPIETKTALATKVTPAFIDDLPPELDPVDSSTFNVASIPNSSSLSKTALDLFGDDDDDDFDNDGAFSTQKSFEPKIPVYDETNDMPTPSDDWPKYLPSSSIAASTTSSVLTNNVFMDKSPPSLGSKNPLSLFGESDSDGEDIFASSKKTAPATKTESKPTSSNIKAESAEPTTSAKKIFSDDSSDDDLFGSGKKKIMASQAKVDASRPAAKSVKLFNDSDDDDDDLFGGKTKEMAASVRKTSTSTKTKSAASSETASSNPLSDLLK